MSDETPDPMASLLSSIRQQRDELKLQMHLASKDAQDQWDVLEKKWDELMERGEPLTSATTEAVDNAGEQAKKVTGAALDVVAREIAAGYEKLRGLLR